MVHFSEVAFVIAVYFSCAYANQETSAVCPFVDDTTVACHDEVYKSSEIIKFAETVRHQTILDFSRNLMPYLKANDFQRFGSIKQLNLSRNEIMFIEVDAFVGLRQLVALDLSHNKLSIIFSLLFRGMEKLEKLFLAGNPIAQIRDGSFDVLPALNYLDVSSARLLCDCHLSWLSHRINQGKIQVSESTTCFTPIKVKDRRLNSLRKDQFICSGALQFPSLEILPAKHQILVAGDGPFQLECLATDLVDGTHIVWTHNGGGFNMSRSTANSLPDRGLMSSTIEFKRISVEDAGIWSCHAWTAGNNETVSTSLTILDENTVRCPANITISSRGSYWWPPTFTQNITVELPCEGEDSTTGATATRVCDQFGSWQSPNVSLCPFRTEFERVMSEYIKPFKFDEAVLASGYLKTYLLNQTSDRVIINSERLDLVLRALETILLTTGSPEIFSNASKVADWLMDTPFHVWEAGKALQVSPRLMNILILSTTVDLARFPMKNYVATVVPVSQQTSEGINCVINANDAVMEIRCFEVGHLVRKRETADSRSETAILIPPTPSTKIRQDLLVFGFRNVKFLASMGGKFLTSSSRVVGVFPRNFQLADTDGVFTVDLTAPLLTSTSEAFYFTPLLSSQLGGCTFTEQNFETGSAKINCRRFGLVTISQSFEVLDIYHNRSLALQIPIFIYISGIIVIVTHVALLLIYATHFTALQMPSVYKHSLLNIWMSLNAVITTFLCGFSETSEQISCITIGILLHYFTLCCLTWHLLGFFYLYKYARKSLAFPNSDVESPSTQKKRQPNIGGLYLFGWGFPVILTGISAAICLPRYANQRYCFLRLPDSLFAVLLPGAVMLLGCLLLVSFLFCLKNKPPVNPNGISAVQCGALGTINSHRNDCRILLSTLTIFLVACGSVGSWAGRSDAGYYRTAFLETVSVYGCGAALLLLSLHDLSVFWLIRRDLPKMIWKTSKNVSVNDRNRSIVPVYESYIPLMQSELTRSPVVPGSSPVTTHTAVDEVSHDGVSLKHRLHSPYYGGIHGQPGAILHDTTDSGYLMQTGGSGHVVSYASSGSEFVTLANGTPRYFSTRQHLGSNSSKIETSI